MKKWMLRVISNLAKVTELGSARPRTQAPVRRVLTTVPISACGCCQGSCLGMTNVALTHCPYSK